MKKLLLALGLAGLAGCTTMLCTEMGCSGSLEVTFEDVALTDGEYRVEADFSSGTEAVTFDVEGGVALTPSDSLVAVSYDGQDLVATFTASMGEQPATVAVRLLDAEESALVTGDVAPEWSDPWYPNGEKCDAAGCSSGTASL